MAYTFDGPNKRIIISAQTSMGVRDVYSRWAEWFATGDNAKYLPAFDIVGGQEIDASAGTSVPIYAYLTNGWRVRPQESSHTLNVFDGVLLVDGGGDPFVNTLGNYVVRINYQQPVQAITVATGGGSGGPSAGDIAAAVWAHLIEAGLSAAETQRLALAVLAGRVSGAGTGTETFKGIDGVTDRVVSTVDDNGNRTAVTLDGT